MFNFISSIFSGIAYAGAVLLWNLGLGAPVIPTEKPAATAELVQQVPAVKVITEADLVKEEVENLKKEVTELKKQKSSAAASQPKPTPAPAVVPVPAPAYVAPKTFTTPNGAVVDEFGNIIKPAPTTSYQPAPSSQDQAAQAKQAKLNAVNQKIAALNTKYAVDIAVARNAGETLAFSEGEMRRVTLQYEIDYATLMAEFQQIQYSN